MINVGDLLKEAEKNKNKTREEMKEAEKNKEDRSLLTGKADPNAGWLFYKDYYIHHQREEGTRGFYGNCFRDNSEKADYFRKKNEVLLEYKPQSGSNNRLFNLRVNSILDLITGDKGLLTGTGIAHGTGEEGEYKLGLQFDYSTGLPYLPGSSIKGILRSFFPGHRQKDDNLGERYHTVRCRALSYMLKTILGLENEEQLNAELANRVREFAGIQDGDAAIYFEYLEHRIFDGIVPARNKETGEPTLDKQGKRVFEPLRMTERDIFYDAYCENQRDTPLLAEDVITPHHSALTDPVPLLFLKVAPNVTVHFFFDLRDDLLLSAESKKVLFREILITFGAGAKRRHGFGELM